MPDKKLTDSEIVKAKELIKKLEEAYNFYYDVSKSMPYDIDTTLRETAICLENCLNEINRLQADVERKDKIYIDLLKTSSERADIISSLQAENESLYKTINNIASSVGKINQKLPIIKAEAYKEFAERLCEDRVSNDPVVIATKCLLNELGCE